MAKKIAVKRKARAVKAVKSKRGSDTRERIIEGAIGLFNRHGVQQVSIEQIAATLKMSPGNIPYYFPAKRDLIHATLDNLRKRLSPLESQNFVAVHDAGGYVIHDIKTLWDFRFFFNALVFLLGDDLELRQQYAEFHRWAIGAVVKALERLVAAGSFAPPQAPNSLELIADNMWSHWLTWLRVQQIETPDAARPSDKALRDCALHLWSLCQPYLESRFSRQLLEELLHAPFTQVQERQPAVVSSAKRKQALRKSSV